MSKPNRDAQPPESNSARIRPSHWVQCKLILTPAMVAVAFLAPTLWLVPLAALLLPLVLNAPTGPTQLIRLGKLMSLQLALVWLFYLIKFGPDSWPAALLLSTRLTLASLPGLWFFLTSPSHHVIAAIRPCLSARSALILGNCLALLPRLVADAHQLYHLQRLRGARIAPWDLWRPGAWHDLVFTLLMPMLIQLLRITQQQEEAMRARGYHDNIEPTHYPIEEHR